MNVLQKKYICQNCKIETYGDYKPCKSCGEDEVRPINIETALEKQLNHDFYKRTDDFRNRIKQKTLEKAAEKYPEPFNPHSWTIEELADHAMAENYDQSNYINGMYEKMIEQEKRIKELEKENEVLRKLTDSVKELWDSPFFQALMNYGRKFLEKR